MYYVMDSAGTTWRGHEVLAQLRKNRLLDYETHSAFSRCEAIPICPRLEFEINPKRTRPDAYTATAAIDVFSRRLVELLGAAGIRFETFEIALVDRRGVSMGESTHVAFHLLECDEAIDVDSTTFSGWRNTGIDKLVLRNDFLESGKLLTRDRKQTNLVIAHEKLKEKLHQAGITGLTFKPVSEYRIRGLPLKGPSVE